MSFERFLKEVVEINLTPDELIEKHGVEYFEKKYREYKYYNNSNS